MKIMMNKDLFVEGNGRLDAAEVKEKKKVKIDKREKCDLGNRSS